MSTYIDQKTRKKRLSLVFQSLYYLFTGLWPLLHMLSFSAESGPKADTWLLRAEGMLILCIIAAFVIDLYTRKYTTSIVFLAISSSIGFLYIDLWHSMYHNMGGIYLTDAVAHMILMTIWSVWLVNNRKG
jgi:hypothetical protein